MTDYTKPRINWHRCNWSECDDGFYFCEGLHDKNSGCDWQKLSSEHLDELIANSAALAASREREGKLREALNAAYIDLRTHAQLSRTQPMGHENFVSAGIIERIARDINRVLDPESALTPEAP